MVVSFLRGLNQCSLLSSFKRTTFYGSAGIGGRSTGWSGVFSTKEGDFVTGAAGVARPELLIFSRGFTLIPRIVHGEYQKPWHNPGQGNFVTHVDATPDSYSKIGGATAFVTRDSNGMVLDRGAMWMPWIVDSLRLEFHALINYTSRERLTQLKSYHEGGPNIIICTDSMEVLNHIILYHFGYSQKKEFKLLAEKVVTNLHSNFPPQTVLQWVPRDSNGLADILSRCTAKLEARYLVKAEAEAAAVIVKEIVGE